MLTSRTVLVRGRPVSVRLEDAYWDDLAGIARREGMSLDDLCASVADRARRLQDPASVGLSQARWLAEALRVFTVAYFRTALAAAEATAPGRRAPPVTATPGEPRANAVHTCHLMATLGAWSQPPGHSAPPAPRPPRH
ncbi:hypothetical protein ABAZ39_13085 [Azospirillum argentinense]|uniref:Ribbon-helix-helix domain-containing protein n=1 Tax=Azospirillum argentinense TaxID=2970906 RepID=A0A060DPV6_9PROT|nr:ribbon-helix-helix domain-containing protein [Azospirillum argentinense]AIB12904.1 hypothetical protein ABAZ39_13085 [Azospirillum argentinense]EZQ09900.1 hypothetical protein ABAZ39_14495 [Azospirillum argentinense]